MNKEKNTFGLLISWVVTVIVETIFIIGFTTSVGESLSRYEVLASFGEVFMSNLSNLQEFGLIPVLFLIAIVIGIICFVIFKKIGFLDEKLFKTSAIILIVILILATIILSIVSLQQYSAVSNGITQYNIMIK